MKYLRRITLLLLIYMGTSVANRSFGQVGHMESEKDYWYMSIQGLWVDGGVGYSTFGYGGITNLNLQFTDSVVFCIGAARSWNESSKFIKCSDYYATAGYIIKKKRSVATFTGGLGYGQYNDSYYNLTTYKIDYTHTNRIGLAIQGKFFYMPTNFLGFGIQVFADANSHQTNGSIMFSIAIGKMNYNY
ncbi:MAG: hypothetical protein WCL14_13900 [Bacteroidota bacterium]